MNEDWCEHFVIFYEQLTFIILKLYRNFYVLYEQDKKNNWLYSFCKNNQFKPKKEGFFFKFVCCYSKTIHRMNSVVCASDKHD